MKSGRTPRTRAGMQIAVEANAYFAQLYHSNTHRVCEHASVRAHLRAQTTSERAIGVGPPGVVSGFTEKCFLSTPLHTDVVQISMMNISLRPYVMVTQGPGAGGGDHVRVVWPELGAAATSSWGEKDHS